MAVSVVEAVFVSDTANATTRTVTLTTTPQAGDYVFMVGNGTVGVNIACSGLGATWALAAQDTIGIGITSVVRIGTGATAAGSVTITSNSSTGTWGLLLVRGLPNTNVLFVDPSTYLGMASIPVGTTRQHPTVASGGGLALGLLSTGGHSLTIAYPASSNTGWTTADFRDYVGGTSAVVYQAVNAATTINLGVENTGSGTVNSIYDMLLLVGDATGALLDGQYVEALTVGTPAAAVEGQYVEALTTGTPAAVVEGHYVEVLAPSKTVSTLDPATLAGKRLWLRAKDLGSGGSSVATWPDQSGLGFHGAATGTAPAVAAGSTPIGGKSVTFNNNQMVMRAVTLTATPGRIAGWEKNLRDASLENYWECTGTATVAAPAVITEQVATALVCTSYAITCTTTSPRDWVLAGSNDGTTWTTLDTRTGVTFPNGTAQWFTYTNSTAYTQYRITITNQNGTGNLQVNEATLTGDGTRRLLADGSPGEMWMVVKVGTGSFNSGSWKFGSSPNELQNMRLGGMQEDFGNATNRGFTPTVDPSTFFRLYRASIDASGNLTVTIDGQTNLTAATGAAPVWALNPKIAGAFAANIAEVLVRDRVSTASEAADLITYFNSEHGLSVPGGSTPTGAYRDAVMADAPLAYWRLGDTTTRGLEEVYGGKGYYGATAVHASSLLPNTSDGSYETHADDGNLQVYSFSTSASAENDGWASDAITDGNLIDVTNNGHPGRWYSATVPAWVQWSTTAAVAPASYAVTSSSDTDRVPKAWTLSGSNDGTTWTVVDTRTAQTFTAGNTTNTYTLTNTTPYRQWRMDISAANNTLGVTLNEVALAGATPVKSLLPGYTGSTFAIEVWARFDSIANSTRWRYFTEVNRPSGASKFYFWWGNQSGTDGLTFGYNDGSWRDYHIPWVPTVGQVYHIVARMSGGVVEFYINGTKVNSLPVVGPGVIPNDMAVPLQIGRSTTGTRYFDGRLDELAFYSDLSPSRIATHYYTATNSASNPPVLIPSFTGWGIPI